MRLYDGKAFESAGTDTLVGIENLIGGTRNDTLEGNAGANVLAGNAGNDEIAGEGGVDVIYGGAGNDWLNGDSQGGFISGDEGNDRVYGGAGDDNIFTSYGNDLAEGGCGNDILLGGDGIDSLRGGDGNDELRGGGANDIVTGGAGQDRFTYMAYDDSTYFDIRDGGRDLFTDFVRGSDKLVITVANEFYDFQDIIGRDLNTNGDSLIDARDRYTTVGDAVSGGVHKQSITINLEKYANEHPDIFVANDFDSVTLFGVTSLGLNDFTTFF